MKNKLFCLGYWIVQLTWGIITTVLGLLVTFVLNLCGYRSKINGYGLITQVGENWGGLSLGPFSFCEDKCDLNFYEDVRKHEFGHSLQVLIFGPLWLIIIGIPSFIRYWYYMLNDNVDPDNYDNIWFERTATRWGKKVVDDIDMRRYGWEK